MQDGGAGEPLEVAAFLLLPGVSEHARCWSIARTSHAHLPATMQGIDIGVLISPTNTGTV
jgi:hypothetical protein